VEAEAAAERAKLAEAAEAAGIADEKYSEAHSFQPFRFLQSEDERRGRGGKRAGRGLGGTKRAGLRVTGSETHAHIAETRGGGGVDATRRLFPHGSSSELLRAAQTSTTSSSSSYDSQDQQSQDKQSDRLRSVHYLRVEAAQVLRDKASRRLALCRKHRAAARASLDEQVVA
jgi:hypothetical protein